MSGQCFISIDKCDIQVGDKKLVKNLTWSFHQGQVWLVTGPSGGGKEVFIQALANEKSSPRQGHFSPPSSYFNSFASNFANSTQLVSLETAAALIQEERNNDEGEFIEGGIDIGRTAAYFIAQVLPQKLDCSQNTCSQEELVETLEKLPEVQLCGVASVLSRGLKYLSTGEIRRVLLCRALLSQCQLLILSEPFAGLDVHSRSILHNFFSQKMKEGQNPAIILSMEEDQEIPSGITHVAEFREGKLAFQGTMEEYNHFQASCHNPEDEQARLNQLSLADSTFQELHHQQTLVVVPKLDTPFQNKAKEDTILVDMKNVRVAWGDKVVLNKLNWQVRAGEHWLIRGPNGSGKTTLLELITGDNMQVFSNDVSLFGHRRGTGETIWELKEKMGIVSYRLHLEYRMVGGTDIEAVLLSGFHDSIGLYQQRSQVEQMAVERWLEIGGFKGRGKEAFNSLSYGEQRAILILRAAVKCPPLLILDEPCHGLDKEQRQFILHLLETIVATGTTTLLHVTHDTSEVLPCEKHVLELLSRQSPQDDDKPCYLISINR